MKRNEIQDAQRAAESAWWDRKRTLEAAHGALVDELSARLKSVTGTEVSQVSAIGDQRSGMRLSEVSIDVRSLQELLNRVQA